MFHHVRDASKVALYHLIQHLVRRGYQLFDIQQLTDHTASLGARLKFLAKNIWNDWRLRLNNR